MEKDSEIYRGKKERVKSIALKAKKESSDDETSTYKRDDEEYAMGVRNFKMFFRRKGKFVRQPREEKKSFRQRNEKKGKSDRKCFRCGDPHHLIGDCPKPSRNKDQKAFIGDGIFFNQSKYIKEMLKKFRLEDSKPTKMSMSMEIKLTKDDEADSVDSSKYQGSIDISKNPVQHSRTKHIEIRHHFLLENVQKGNISIEKVASEDNIADIFTKPLKREVFNYLRLGLGMMELIMDSDPSSFQK
uniref:Retrovirus-related Pol polyprotein from transposon TNT 1-94 n=1 Tax=Tanacetum cinerariifolium TaxID=118510 RepID=A0A6L2P3D4_TANCI|nr:retrovirus-related Pol polyprotein from transposon TNT 1-94 [Tanacetum cinerariifolium]